MSEKLTAERLEAIEERLAGNTLEQSYRGETIDLLAALREARAEWASWKILAEKANEHRDRLAQENQELRQHFTAHRDELARLAQENERLKKEASKVRCHWKEDIVPGLEDEITRLNAVIVERNKELNSYGEMADEITRLEQENERLRESNYGPSVVAVMHDKDAEITRLAQENERLQYEIEDMLEGHAAAADWGRAEIKRLREHVDDLQSGMYINCVYCGHRYGPSESHPATLVENGPLNMKAALKEHIEKCPEHPMSRLRERVAELEVDKNGQVEVVRLREEQLANLQERIDELEHSERVRELHGTVDSMSRKMDKDIEFMSDQEQQIDRLKAGLRTIMDLHRPSIFHGEQTCSICEAYAAKSSRLEHRDNCIYGIADALLAEGGDE